MSSEGSWDISRILQYGRDVLRDCSGTPDLDAQLLLCHVLGLTKLQIIIDAKKEVDANTIEGFKALLQRRKNNEPVAYITGKKEFWGIEFEVSPTVLIPRPDTELLVDMALTFSAEFPNPILICDLGTGSGCIPIALAFELKRRERNFFALACDKSFEAIKLAKRNAAKQGYSTEIQFVCSDWSSAIKHDFDLVLSNPPYLMENDPEISPELKFEPQSALYSGQDGLDDYRKIFTSLPELLSPKGVFLGEIGYGQAHLIEALAKELLPRHNIEFHYDLCRVQRVVEVRLSSK